MNKMNITSLLLGMVQTNCYLIQNKDTQEVLIVDPADNAGRIQQKLQEMGGKAVAILLTHGHFDHMMAAGELRDSLGISIYACSQEERLLEDSGLNLSGSWAAPCTLKADVLVKEGQELTLGGFVIRVMHTPGHTAGSCCYYFPQEDVLISGDTLFEGSVGRTDFPTSSGGDMMRSLHRLLAELPQETRVFPGHGGESTIGYEKRYNPFA